MPLRIQRSLITAKVCSNGHAKSHQSLNAEDFESKGAFCTDCGAGWIYACPNCKAQIQVLSQRIRETHDDIPPKVPSFCGFCGHAFTWTEKHQTAMANLLAKDPQRDKLMAAMPGLMVEKPDTVMSVQTWKSWFTDASVFVADAAKEILKAIGTEYVKKELGL